MKKAPIAMLGAGSWGTALAILLAHNEVEVRLWDHDPAQIANLKKEHCNRRYLPEIFFPPHLTLESDLAAALENCQDIFICVPSHAFNSILEKILPYCSQARIAWGSKGIDPATGNLLHQCVQNVIGHVPMAILSGPSFAKEVALGLPTAVTLASNDPDFQESLVNRFHNPMFRVYNSDDLIGVQVAGAVKNVIAIAVGASDGLGFGANARCALITRGLAEMLRLGIALGAKQQTFMGLAGIGDLVLTATDDQSRNRRFGRALGTKKDLQAAKQEIDQVIEGANNAEIVYRLAQQYEVEMPLVESVYKIVSQQMSVEEAVRALVARAPRRSEFL